jgi:predicted house-cleaning NTP pyrophosphatase (Maf/HAM1 superfamily)
MPATANGAAKAGGYALQGYGEVYVRHIAGSYSNVVGLPLAETRLLLKSAGYRLPEWLIERGIGESPRRARRA